MGSDKPEYVGKRRVKSGEKSTMQRIAELIVIRKAKAADANRRKRNSF